MHMLEGAIQRFRRSYSVRGQRTAIGVMMEGKERRRWLKMVCRFPQRIVEVRPVATTEQVTMGAGSHGIQTKYK